MGNSVGVNNFFARVVNNLEKNKSFLLNRVYVSEKFYFNLVGKYSKNVGATAVTNETLMELCKLELKAESTRLGYGFTYGDYLKISEYVDKKVKDYCRKIDQVNLEEVKQSVMYIIANDLKTVLGFKQILVESTVEYLLRIETSINLVDLDIYITKVLNKLNNKYYTKNKKKIDNMDIKEVFSKAKVEIAKDRIYLDKDAFNLVSGDLKYVKITDYNTKLFVSINGANIDNRLAFAYKVHIIENKLYRKIDFMNKFGYKFVYNGSHYLLTYGGLLRWLDGFVLVFNRRSDETDKEFLERLFDHSKYGFNYLEVLTITDSLIQARDLRRNIVSKTFNNDSDFK